jgi:monovalent cation:H+ antiporter-2, CPA2 family
MDGAHEFLKALAVVLCTAAVTTVVFQRLRQPVILGYILAGLIVGPHVPAVPLVADREIVQTLSELGVILLLFSLGLEFKLGKLFKVGPRIGPTAAVECSFMLWLGFTIGQLFGWSLLESLFAGAIIAISSTTIVAKAFEEQAVRGKLRELVVGVLIVEDLIAILLMAGLTAIATGQGLGAGALAWTTGRLAAFLAALVVFGLLLIPRSVRAIVRLDRPETTLVASVGICFAIALLAQEFGYSVALGAFIAGSLVAESGEEHAIEPLVRPVRDLFGAVFFVSVGMLIDPALLLRHWAAIAAFTAAVLFGKVLSVSLGAFLTGHGVRTSLRAGMSLAQIGEFSFIIAGLGLSLRAGGEFLYPVAVAVSAITTLSTPWLIRASGPFANFVDRKLPRPLQTFAALYGSWLEQLRAAPRAESSRAHVRRLIWRLARDAAFVAAIVIGASLWLGRLAAWLQVEVGLERGAARITVMATAAALLLPFCLGIFRVVQRLGYALAETALPKGREGKVDLAAAPRKSLVVTLQMALVALVGTPLVALTQPFLPGSQGVFVLLALSAALAVAFWRSATNLQGHVSAGAEIILEVLAAQTKKDHAPPDEHALDQVCMLLPGLGEPVPVQLEAESPAVGKTIADLNVRGLTGATILVITREGKGLTFPGAREVLRSGDVLAVAGTREAIEGARALLLGEETAEARPFDTAERAG